MSPYAINFHAYWDSYFSRLDNSMKKRVMKKILQLQQDIQARHLKKGLDFYVSEMGQYRLIYKINESAKTKTLYFVGTHKEYEKWLGL
ncbi:MAG: type II toxin-antitoxin system HigB family toxin [Candidatus Micrarchaeota archaeon]|nr:type II toxin-antitoxin system HigB family toxin [Candidatus Micrarchaeota archaeon]